MVSTNDIRNLNAAVKANPTDITARLALADAYEEQGNDSAAREQRTLANLTTDERVATLARFLDVDEDDVVQIKCIDNSFEADGGEYYVLTEQEADRAVSQEILDSIWAFKAEFVAEHSRAPYSGELIRVIRSVQDQHSEDSNDLLRSTLESEEEFVRAAVASDGRGKFLAGYDHNENEVQFNGATIYIYRIN